MNVKDLAFYLNCTTVHCITFVVIKNTFSYTESGSVLESDRTPVPLT
jgi:hypothetical protein